MEGLRRPAVDSASPQPDPEKQSAEAECRSLCDAQLSDIIMSFGLKHGALAQGTFPPEDSRPFKKPRAANERVAPVPADAADQAGSSKVTSLPAAPIAATPPATPPLMSALFGSASPRGDAGSPRIPMQALAQFQRFQAKKMDVAFATPIARR